MPDTDTLMVEVFVRCAVCGGTGRTPLPPPQVRMTVGGVDVKGTCKSCQGDGGERRRVSLADFKRLLSEA
jgi:DnaJ-class molecular chaperone